MDYLGAHNSVGAHIASDRAITLEHAMPVINIRGKHGAIAVFFFSTQSAALLRRRYVVETCVGISLNILTPDSCIVVRLLSSGLLCEDQLSLSPGWQLWSQSFSGRQLLLLLLPSLPASAWRQLLLLLLSSLPATVRDGKHGSTQ